MAASLQLNEPHVASRCIGTPTSHETTVSSRKTSVTFSRKISQEITLVTRDLTEESWNPHAAIAIEYIPQRGVDSTALLEGCATATVFGDRESTSARPRGPRGIRGALR